MSQDVAALQIRLEATTARFERQLQRADRAMQRRTRSMSRSAQTLDRRLEKVGDKFGVNLAVRAAAAAAAIAAIGKVVTDVARNGDKFKLLEARFTALTGSAERGEAAFQGVLGIVQETGTSIDDVAGSVSRFTLAAEAIGATDEEVRQLTENVIKLGQVGGASNQELSSGAQQLAQALASGRLQGDELRSILENMPLVAKAIADGLGVSVGHLRQMGSEGELTARKVFDAILSKTDEVEDQFSQLPVTLDRAAGQLAGAWSQFTAELDESLGVSQALVRVLQGATALINQIGQVKGPDEQLIADIERLQTLKRLNEPRPGNRMAGTKDAEIANLTASIAERTRQAAATKPVTVPKAADVSGGTPRRRGGGGRSSRQSVDTDSAARMVQSVRDRIQALNDERGAIGLVGGELARYNARVEASRIENELLALARKENTVVTEAEAAEIRNLANEYVVLSDIMANDREQLEANAKAAEKAAKQQEDLANSIENAATNFANAITQAESFEDALKAIGAQLAQLAAQAVAGQGPLGGLFNELIGVTAGGVGGLFSGGTGSAAGSTVKAGGTVTKFATGGIVRGPTPFPMANGSGLMGEAGPEAIMPLSRGPGGKLGVAASVGGSTVIVNTENHAGAEITAQQSGPNLGIMVEQAVAKSIAQGGRVHKSIRQTFQLSSPTTRR